MPAPAVALFLLLFTTYIPPELAGVPTWSGSSTVGETPLRRVVDDGTFSQDGLVSNGVLSEIGTLITGLAAVWLKNGYPRDFRSEQSGAKLHGAPSR